MRKSPLGLFAGRVLKEKKKETKMGNFQLQEKKIRY